jgi:hypothetical protein
VSEPSLTPPPSYTNLPQNQQRITQFVNQATREGDKKGEIEGVVVPETVDLPPGAPQKYMQEEDYLKALTTYEAYTIFKGEGSDTASDTAWASCQTAREKMSQEEIIKVIKTVDAAGTTAILLKANLTIAQQKQINTLMDRLASRETDSRFEWSMSQLSIGGPINDKGKREINVIVVVAMRAPIKAFSMVRLFQELENQREGVSWPSPPPITQLDSHELLPVSGCDVILPPI